MVRFSTKAIQSAKLIVAGLVTVVAFQNCSGGFEAMPKSTNLASSGGNSNEGGIAPVCTNGATESGYSMGSAAYPVTCGALQTKTCVNGQWDKNIVLVPTCKQQCIHPDTKQAVDEGSTYTSYSAATGTTQATCDAAKVTSTCDKATGTFLPAIAANKACLVQGQVCAYPTGAGLALPTGNMVNDTVNGYPTSTATYPTLCGAKVTRSCQASGQWTGTVPLYTACAQKCVHPDNGQPVDAASNYSYYTLQSGSQAQCQAALVTSSCSATTGQFSPAIAATRFATCTVILPVAISSFTASASTVESGLPVTLTWATANAVTLTLNPGMVNVTGQTSVTLMPSTTTTYTLVATNSIGSTSSSVTVTVTGPLLGAALYESRCANCHSPLDASNLKGRTITTAIIDTAIKTKISAMKGLDGTMSVAQLDSLTALFANATPPPPLTSSFACASAEAEKDSSAQLIRLTGTELRNTYIANLPAAVWSGLSTYYYLLPSDNFEGLITKFNGQFTADIADQISRFNEQVANQIVLNNTNVTAFFGACASLTAFPKTCFDTFLTSKGPFLFRSALDAGDNAALWTVVTQANTVPNQLKTLVQLLFNDPRFVYHLELGSGAASATGLYTLTSYEVANRIAYGMTAAPPDSALWADAVANRLTVLANATAHVDRIAQTPAYRARIVDFIKFYTGTAVAGVAPQIPAFLNGVNATNLDVAATNEFNEFVNYVIFTQNGTLADLFTSKAAFPQTAALAGIFGTGVWSSGAPLTATNHPGILSKPYMLLMNDPNMKLVQRGKKLRINMLCSDVPQPSATDLANRPTLSAADLVNLNRRQYIDKATLSSASCIACHSKMNQLGYATESYDSIGRFSTTERIFDTNNVQVATHPVVTSSMPTITENDKTVYANFNDFLAGLVQSDTLHQCITRKAFQFMQRKEEVFANDSCRLNKMDTLIKQNRPLQSVLLENFKQQSLLYKRSP